MPPKCSCQLKHPDANHLTSLVISAQATPCPMRVGGTATHKATVKNQRSNSIYEVEVTVRSGLQGVIFDNDPSITEFTKIIRGIASHSDDYADCIVSENPNGSSSMDDIETAITLYDATQKVGTTFVGRKEQASVDYTLEII